MNQTTTIVEIEPQNAYAVFQEDSEIGITGSLADAEALAASLS